MSLILGIDPGFTGALALYDTSTASVVDVYDMPTKAMGILDGRSIRAEIDPKALAAIIGPLSQRLTLAVVERVHASPDAGVTSMFRFGEGYGLLIGTLYGSGVKRVLTPVSSVWKVSMGLNRDKRVSIDATGQLLGSDTQKKYCSRIKDHGRAEAILLCLYGAKSLKNESKRPN